MGTIFAVISLLLAMFIVSFVAGYWPGVIKDTKVVNLLGIIGGGFLMGSAVLIVLPESINVLANSKSTNDNLEHGAFSD
jgi:zinc transporter ZupT